MTTIVDPLIALPKLHQAEIIAASYLAQLIKNGCDKIDPYTDGLKDIQPLAVENACNNRISILTGPPGTGKTTTTRAIIKSFRDAGMKGITLCPSGMAARRAKEAAGEHGIGMNFKTIHSGLEWNAFDHRFAKCKYNPLDIDFLIVDEFPMTGTTLLAAALEAINPLRTRVVLVGDPEQLPSIEAGNIGRDLISCGFIKTIRLTKILRQGENSGMVVNCSRILNGDPLIQHDENGNRYRDFIVIPIKDSVKAADSIIQYVEKDIPQKRGFDPVKDIQLVSPGKKSVVGTKSLGDRIGSIFNPSGKKVGNVKVGDRVFNSKNNSSLNIVNGDVGFAVDYQDQKLVIDFGKGSGPKEDGIVEVGGEALDSIHPAWGQTVHKLQGSERKCVIMPVYKCHSTMLFRQILYTGMSRGKELTALVVDPTAVDICINTNKAVRRVTNLVPILSSLMAKTK